jgi:4-hydroxythreonine-4-phosphate dehydrogenase
LDHVTRSPCLAGRQARHRVTGVELIDLKNVPRKDFKFGKIKAEYGRASMEYLDKAMELIKSKEIDCLVTCPISKESIKQAGFRWYGHTEYLADRAGVVDYAMMLLNEQLKTVLITRHIPLKSVSAHIDADKINKTILLTFNSLKKLFLIKEPRIVLCGVNPHASDNGVIGNEENDIIKPALKKLRKKIRYLDGPLSADVAISKAFRKHYDCVVAMYHDQALIPLKILQPNTGVNMTLGLGFIRTSPLHGTAFDIAEKYGLSNPHSLIAAIKLSIKCTLNQKNA